MMCKVCGQPVRIIPTTKRYPYLIDTWNTLVTKGMGYCMRCLIAAKKAKQEADSMTYEQRAEVNLKRMKDKKMTDKEIAEAVKTADEMGKK
jgi:hypothetical protein